CGGFPVFGSPGTTTQIMYAQSASPSGTKTLAPPELSVGCDDSTGQLGLPGLKTSTAPTMGFPVFGSRTLKSRAVPGPLQELSKAVGTRKQTARAGTRRLAYWLKSAAVVSVESIGVRPAAPSAT